MKKIILFSLLFLIVGGGIWMGRTPYRNWKQRRFLVQAQAFLDKSDYRNAVLCARKTLEINASNVDACRIMARITDQFKFTEAIFWRHRILDLEPNVVQNRLDLARSALLLGNIRETDMALHSVKEADRNRADFHEMAALLDVAENNILAAEAQASAAAKLDPQNKSLQFNLAVLDVQSRNKQLVHAATASLEELSADPAFRRDALRQLALTAARDGDFAKAVDLSQKLQLEKPLAFEDQLLNLTVLRDARSADFAASLASLESQVADNPPQINALSGWLMGQLKSDEALRWLLSLPPKTRLEQPVIVALADCYAARRDWARMQSLLAKPKWGESDFLRLALLSRAIREQKDPLGAQVNWHSAVTLASGHRQPLSVLVRLANAWGWDSEKEEAAWLLIQRFPGEIWALGMLDRFYAVTGNTRNLQKVYAALIKNDPSDVMAKNNFAATSLLLGLELPQAYQIAKDNYTRFPQDIVMISTYTFSLHLQGRTKEALKILETLPPDKLRQPMLATYYGVLLAADGQPAKARVYLDIAGRSILLPEEKALVAAALNPPPPRVNPSPNNRSAFTGNTHDLQKAYAALMKNDASDVIARNDFATVSLLLGLQLPEAHQIAKENYALFPHEAVMVSTYAFSLHLQGRTRDGLKALEKLPEDELQQPEVATYYGVLLAADGQSARARTYLDIAVARSNLLPEEKAMVADARKVSSPQSSSSSKN